MLKICKKIFTLFLHWFNIQLTHRIYIRFVSNILIWRDKMKMLKNGLLGMLILGGMLIGSNVAEARSRVIQAKGSDTILNVSQAISENYMKENRKARIAVTGGGSGVGISALINGTTDIAMASRSIKDKEIEQAKAKGLEVKEVVLGFDGITIISNHANPVKDLDDLTLGKVFRGEITNWKELGGEDAPIVVLSRDSSSGTHEFFKEHIIRENNTKKDLEYGPKTLYMPSNEAIKQEVKANKYAIGYIGMGYMDDSVEAIKVDGVEASVENVASKKYPIAREVYWYVDSNASEEVNGLVDYALSSKGQELVKEEGFVPVK